MYQIHSRPPTSKELYDLRQRQRTTLFSKLFVGAAFAVVPFLLMGQLCWWLATLFDPGHQELWRWVGYGAVGYTFYIMTQPVVSFWKTESAAIQADLNEQVIEEIAVSYTAACQFTPSENGISDSNLDLPMLEFALDDRRTLLLVGIYLLDPQTYEAGYVDHPESGEDLPQESSFNQLPPPFAFPSDRFVVTRWRHCGTVLSIRIHGGYLPPESRDMEYFKSRYQFNDLNLPSQILETPPPDQLRLATG